LAFFSIFEAGVRLGGEQKLFLMIEFRNLLFLSNCQIVYFEFSRRLMIFRCRILLDLYRRYLSRLNCYRFEISATLHHLGWIDAPHTQNFEISRANSGVKKIKIIFEFFVKTLDGSNFG
jgi:hypothetical protein